jgi:ABC-2 type transport system permease protein
MTELDIARYHGWHGRLHSPWIACLSIVRVAMLQVFRRKSYWLILALGLTQFIVFWVIIYCVTQLRLPEPMQRQMFDAFGFSSQPDSNRDDGYIQFMERQNVVVTMLLAFSGSLLVGSDFRSKSLPFYLSRRIDRRHYIVGKLLAISSLVALLTVVPALLLFFEYGMFSASTQYWRDNWRIAVSVLAYGAVLCVVNSILLTTLAAYLQRLAPIAITWSSIFILLGRFSSYLHDATDNHYWKLLDPWRDMRYVGRLAFGTFRRESDRELAWWALGLLTVVCALALVALVRRVRSVEIVN